MARPGTQRGWNELEFFFFLRETGIVPVSRDEMRFRVALGVRTPGAGGSPWEGGSMQRVSELLKAAAAAGR